MPQRIQRRRVRGWRMPPGAIYVGRPGRWGNPFRTAAEYEASLTAETITAAKRELRGHDLACWCPLNQPCHADVLLRIANERDECEAKQAEGR